MTYFSLIYALLFLPATILLYSIIPKKFRYIILLIASITFYILISSKLIIFLLISIISIYLSGRLLAKIDKDKDLCLESSSTEEKKSIKEKYKHKKKIVLVITILFNIAFLFFFKYLNFFLINTNSLLNLLGINYSFKIIKYIAPIGISFYTLQAISYLVDVYNNKINSENNILKLGLYLSFFPSIMEGPIARFEDVAPTLFSGEKVTYKNLCFGYQRILYGFFKKYVIADRINILVKIVFSNYTAYSGISCWLAVIGFTVMLYAEFSGTMDVVIGTGEIFGISMPENFRQPFFSKNISEFWTRWHITLGAWFKNYIFYPVSLSKPMKKITLVARRKLGNHFGALISGSIALFAVWFLNGLWHGAGYTYLFFGLFHFTMILLANIFEPTIIKICDKLKINRKNILYRIFQSIKMTIIVFIGELFFKAPTLSIGFGMLKKMFTDFSIPKHELLCLGLDIQDYIIVIIAIIFIFIISLLKEKGINIRESIAKKKIVTRWILYYGLILSVIFFGAYGPGYVPVDPIYADF